MSKIEAFKKAKTAATKAKGWYEMVGKKYFGGTSGQGELGSVVKAEVSLTIYYQHSDGAKNYHESPDELDFALSAVIKRHHKALIEEAISNLTHAAKTAAAEAVEEHARLMQEAGVDLPA